MKYQRRKRILFVFFWTGLICSFIFLLALIHLQANGWQFNFRTGKFLQTGMIVLNGAEPDAKITVNGKPVVAGINRRLANLLPGSYDVSVSKDQFQTWEKTITVESGRANIQNVILFSASPQETSLPKDLTAEELSQKYQEQSEKLKISGAEIYYQNELVSRFSQNVLAAVLMSNRNYLIFQQADEIRVMEVDGANNRLLFKLSSNEPSKFYLKDNTLIYQDKGAILARIIR